MLPSRQCLYLAKVLCNTTNSFPGTFRCSYYHAAATAFHFTPNCYVINHLPRVWVCFPDYHPARALGTKAAALGEETPLCLRGGFTVAAVPSGEVSLPSLN